MRCHSPRFAPFAAFILLLTACASEPDPGLPGQLEWDRIAMPAEVSEPVVSITVHEGQTVAPGDPIAELDPRRAEARLERAAAELLQREERLSELIHGARPETLDAARAALTRAQASAEDANREARRLTELRQRELIAQADLDRADATRRKAAAEVQAADAQLRELTSGTRDEQLAQAEAAVVASRAAFEEARLARERLTLKAPRSGRIDALPFKVGDQPPLGATVVSMLVGETPYARVYIPAGKRAALREGDAFDVQVTGIAEPFRGTLRRIASEPAFTPYYALAGDDASRLVFRAEIELSGDAARQLPAGLPLMATPVAADAR